VQLKDILKETRRGKVTKVVLFLHDNAALTGRLQPRRNWPTWASSVLITHPVLQIWPRRTTICSLDWKTIERSPFFVRRGGHCCRGDLVGRTNFRLFLSGLQKLEQWAKKCIELREEYVEYIPNLVVVACFLPGRAKELSAPPRILARRRNHFSQLFNVHGFNYVR